MPKKYGTQFYSTFDVGENTTFQVFTGEPPSNPTATTAYPTATTKTPTKKVPTEPFAQTFCLIKSAEDECLDLHAKWDGEANMVSVVTNIFSLQAYQQSWEVIWYPHYNACLLRNGFRVFLQLIEVDPIQNIYSLRVGGGRTDEACYWELIPVQSDPDTEWEYKIRNIKFNRYLQVVGGSISVTDNEAGATIWDFEISGTVPP